MTFYSTSLQYAINQLGLLIQYLDPNLANSNLITNTTIRRGVCDITRAIALNNVNFGEWCQFSRFEKSRQYFWVIVKILDLFTFFFTCLNFCGVHQSDNIKKFHWNSSQTKRFRYQEERASICAFRRSLI